MFGEWRASFSVFGVGVGVTCGRIDSEPNLKNDWLGNNSRTRKGVLEFLGDCRNLVTNAMLFPPSQYSRG